MTDPETRSRKQQIQNPHATIQLRWLRGIERRASASVQFGLHQTFMQSLKCNWTGRTGINVPQHDLKTVAGARSAGSTRGRNLKDSIAETTSCCVHLGIHSCCKQGHEQNVCHTVALTPASRSMPRQRLRLLNGEKEGQHMNCVRCQESEALELINLSS